jgi:type I restriction enzyme S subunit
MIDGLRPYAEMSSSGVDWLPALPNGWEIHRAKYSFREADDRSESGAEELLSVSHKTGVTPRSQKNITMFMAESYEGHKVCRPGDIVVNTMWAWMAAIGLSRHIGIVSPAYGIYRPRTAERFEPKFLDYLLRIEAYRAEYLRSSRGVTTSRLRLYPPDFLNIPFVQPPLDEQRLIVRFLDWHGAQTAKLVRAKKKIIALLNEQKQAIIHRAVTRGLDPNAKLKASGIPSLGDVPEGWEVKPLKHWAGINQRALSQNTDPDYAFDYIDISAVATGYLSATPERMRFEASPSRARRIVRQGDTLISTVRTYLKAIYHVDRPWPDLIASTGFAVLTPRPSIDARFFGFVLQSKTFVDLVVANSIGVAYPAISQSRLGSLHVCLPLSRQKQEEIISYLQTETVDFDRSIEATQREIALIQEFRTRLIADVVTGKLDVRAAAASLPEVTEPEPNDDLGQSDDLDDTIDATENEEVAA